MTDLGDFAGEAYGPVDVTFGYFGSSIRVHPDLTDVALFELFGGGERSEGPFIDLVVDTLIHPDDVDVFRRVVRENRQRISDLSLLARWLLETLVDRPTSRSSASPDGPPPTDISSGDDVFSEALRATEGRPDLQATIIRRRDEVLAAATG